MNQSPKRPDDPNSAKHMRAIAEVVFWRTVFSVNCVFALLNILSVPYAKSIGPIEILDFTCSNIALVGVYGFVFKHAIGKPVFWRYFFYVALLETLLVLGILPLVGFPFYGEPLSVNLWLINVVNTVLVLIALNCYAYKRPSIWTSST